MKVKLFSVLAVAALLSFSAFRYYNEDLSDFDAARKASNEQYLDVRLGLTRYRVLGEEYNPTVILVHSFNGYLESWNPNIEALLNAGYRVVTYDLWGRGLSDRPRVDLDLKAFRNQLNAIVDQLGVNQIHLVGSSFGCVVASDYALKNPDRVKRLVLIGPAGWPSEGDKATGLLKIPVIGDAVFQYFGRSILKPKVEEYLYDKKAHYWAVEKWQQYASYPGFTRSSLSILRHSPVLDYTNGWLKLGKLGKPTLFIWGKKDVSFPFSNTEKVAAMIPHAKIVGVEAAAHWVNIEKPLQVNEAMISFLAQ